MGSAYRQVMNLFKYIQAVFNYAQQTEEWLVVVTPNNSGDLGKLMNLSLAIQPSMSRTWFLPAGKVSLLELSHALNTEGDFSVSFLGFEDVALTSQDELLKAAWIKKAKKTVAFGMTPEEVSLL